MPQGAQQAGPQDDPGTVAGGGRSRVDGLGPRTILGKILALSVVQRLGLLAVGLASVFPLHPRPPLNAMALQMWSRWDAPHYLRIAEVGYRTTGEDRLFIGFFPFYPIVVRVFSLAFRSTIVSGVIVSFVASVGAAWFLYQLVRIDAAGDQAWRSVVLLVTFPTAYFLAAPYSEATSLCAVLGSIYCMRRGRWGWAAVWGAVATATRPTAIVLIPTFVLAALSTPGALETRLRRLGWAPVVAAGLGAFALFSWKVFHDPFAYLTAQREHWFQRFVPPWTPIGDAVVAVHRLRLDLEFATIYWGRLAAFAFAAILLLAGWRRLRAVDQFYGWSSLAVLVSTSWLTALPRFLLGIYPLFFVMSWLSRRRQVFWALITFGLLWQAFFFFQYARREWTF